MVRKMKSIKAIFRRGQQTSKIEAQTPEDLSRSSSVTNLNADQKSKGAKPKKADSKDRLDRIAEKKHDKNRALNKNNNKESADHATDSLTDVEALQKQLAQMANDKSNLALQLGEQTGYLTKLQNEIAQLKMLQEESNQKIEQLMDENTVLRNRLRDVAHSPLSDNEKQQLLYESHRHHSSAPASIATNLLDDAGDITACPTPEWDKHSSSNVSEVSVACLQDKINQMQETHYSTNEELQATLQELTDLQKQLTELQQENLRLNDEKTLMFESLCRQTERLNDSRNEVESLKQLLYKDENGQFETAAEREQKLVDLLKSAQEEREALLMKQEQLSNELEDSRAANLMHNNERAQLSERVKTLESTLDAKHAEHKQLDQELAQAKDQSSSRLIEINRLKDLLENARTKINELEQDRTLSDKSELDELLDNARKEKDALESEVTHLKEQLALSKNEIEKLREQVSILQEECKVTRNNAKTTQSDLEYKLEKVINEKNAITDQLQQFQEVVNELEVQAQCHLDDKRQLSTVLSETQRNLNESERRIMELDNELTELKKIKQEQEEEWEKFQNDLLTSVRVANDFKTEAQQDLQKLIMENKAGRERIKQLETQIEKLKGGSRRKTPDKRMSNEEMLMASLNRRYKEIESVSEDRLTEEQKAIRLLKLHYDKDCPHQKPKSHKPKDKLAISKPTLESVISNPKLEKIVTDSQLRNVESISCLSDDEQQHRQTMSPRRLSLVDSLGMPIDEIIANRNDSFPKLQSDSGIPVESKEEELMRSKSLTDLPQLMPEAGNLRRYDSTENLLTITKGSKVRKQSTVNLNTLEKICNSIDPTTPEENLTKEQRLALRLRDVLINETRKATLKKNSKLIRKKVDISRPTKESVESNKKLRQIINDPVMKTVGSDIFQINKGNKVRVIKKSKERYSMPASPKVLDDSLRSQKKSKSYNDITFKFQMPNMYSEDENTNLNDSSILPPEQFRDTPPSVINDNSVFNTFQFANNTFNKQHDHTEHDEIDESNQRKTLKVNDQKVDDNEIISEHFTDLSDYNYSKDDRGDFVDNVSNASATDFDEESSSFLDDFDVSEVDGLKDDFNIEDPVEIHDTINEVITRQLEYDDDLIYDFDEEEKVARRGTRQRYSQVIVEIKKKLEKSSDDELDEEKDTKSKKNRDEELIVDVIDDMAYCELEKSSVVGSVMSEYEEQLSEPTEDANEFLETDDRLKLQLVDGTSGSNSIETQFSTELNSSEHKSQELHGLVANEQIIDKTQLLTTRIIPDILQNDSVDGTDLLFENHSYYNQYNEHNKHREEDELRESDNIEDKRNKISNLTSLTRKTRPEDSDVHNFSQVDSYNESDHLVQVISTDTNSQKTEDIIIHSEDTVPSREQVILISDTDYFTNYKLVDTVIDPVIPNVGRYDDLSRNNITYYNEQLSTSESKDTEHQRKTSYEEEPNISNDEHIEEMPHTEKSVRENLTMIPVNIETGQNLSRPLFDIEEETSPDKSREQYLNDIYEEGIYLTEKFTGDGIDLVQYSSPYTPLSEIKPEDSVLIEKLKEQYSDETNTIGEPAFVKQPRVDKKDQYTDTTKNYVKTNLMEFTDEETKLIEQYSSRRPSRPLSDIKLEDLALIDRLNEEYCKDDMNEEYFKDDSTKGEHPLEQITGKERIVPYSHSEKVQDNLLTHDNLLDTDQNVGGGIPNEEQKTHTLPRILSPTKLNQPPSYEPVYANCFISSNRTSLDTQYFVSGKKPVALPRTNSVDTSEPPIYRDFGGQMSKTRFSIDYERKKKDSFKETNQGKSVKEMKNFFERKSKSDFSRLISKALEENDKF